MKKLKKWLETIITVVLVLIGLVIMIPICIVLMWANMAFTGARWANNAMAAVTVISTIGYIGHLARYNIGLGSDGTAALIITVAVVILIGVWDLLAWALWRWRPDWLDAITSDDDWPPQLQIPQKIQDWLKRADRKTELIINIVSIIAVIAIAAIPPFTSGMDGLTFVLDHIFGLALTFIAGAIAWPIIVLIGWLPRCRKRKFGEFFCAATLNCQVVLFGKVLEDDQKQ